MGHRLNALLLCLPLALVACNDDDNAPPPTNTGGGGSQTGSSDIVAVEDNKLFEFSPATPGTIRGEVTLTGYQGEDSSSPPFVIAMDTRPDPTGALYVLMSDNRLYAVNVSTGAMTAAGQFAVDPGVVIRTFSWDTTRGRIRALGSNRENYDLNADGTLSSRDSDLQYASGDPHAADTPSIEALSFTGGNGSTQTTAYGVDGTLDTLVTVGNVNGSPSLPDSGQVFTVANLSHAVGGAGSPPFDVDPRAATASAYLTDSNGTETHLFRVNLANGAMTDLGEVGVDRRVQALAVVPASGTPPPSGGGNPPPPTGGGSEELCTAPITGAGTTVTVGSPSPQCLGCDVLNPATVIDANPDNFATFVLEAGVLLGGIPLRVHAAPGVVYPAGQIAGGVFNFPPADLLELAVAPDLTFTTYLDGEVQESNTLGGDNLLLDIAGGVVNTDKFLAGMTTTLPFDAVEIFPDVGVVGALTRLNMYSACAGSADEGSFP